MLTTDTIRVLFYFIRVFIAGLNWVRNGDDGPYMSLLGDFDEILSTSDNTITPTNNNFRVAPKSALPFIGSRDPIPYTSLGDHIIDLPTIASRSDAVDCTVAHGGRSFTVTQTGPTNDRSWSGLAKCGCFHSSRKGKELAAKLYGRCNKCGKYN